jgi:hypothetical protein
MDHCVRPDANSKAKPDFGSVNFTCLRVRQFIGDMELLMYQQQQRVAELEDKHKQCKCKHDTQAMAHLAEKVAYLEEELKSKEEQLRMNEQLQQAAVLYKTKPKGAAKHKKVGNGWILFMKQRSLEKDLGEKFETLEAFLDYAKDNEAGKKQKRHNKVSLPKKGKGVGLKEFLKEMSEEYKALDKEMKTEYNDAAKKLALSENMGASPEIEKEIHM